MRVIVRTTVPIVIDDRAAFGDVLSSIGRSCSTTSMLAINTKEAEERVYSLIGIRISYDTLLRILRRVPVPSEQPESI